MNENQNFTLERYQPIALDFPKQALISPLYTHTYATRTIISDTAMFVAYKDIIRIINIKTGSVINEKRLYDPYCRIGFLDMDQVKSHLRMPFYYSQTNNKFYFASNPNHYRPTLVYCWDLTNNIIKTVINLGGQTELAHMPWQTAVTTWPSFTMVVQSIQQLRDGSLLIATCLSIKLVKNSKIIAERKRNLGIVSGLLLMPNEKKLVVRSYNSNLILIDLPSLQTSNEYRQAEFYSSYDVDLMLHPHEKDTVILHHHNNQATLWNIKSGRVKILSFPDIESAKPGYVRHFSSVLLSDGKLAVRSGDNVCVVNVMTGLIDQVISAAPLFQEQETLAIQTRKENILPKINFVIEILNIIESYISKLIAQFDEFLLLDALPNNRLLLEFQHRQITLKISDCKSTMFAAKEKPTKKVQMPHNNQPRNYSRREPGHHCAIQ